MEFISTNEFAFPADNCDYTYGGLFPSGNNSSQKWCDQTGFKGLMKKDTGISSLSTSEDSRTIFPENKLKLGLNFSRSRTETACETDLTLSRSSSDRIEIVDLTNEAEHKKKFAKFDAEYQGYSQEEEPEKAEYLGRNRAISFEESSNKKQKRRKKSLLLQDIDALKNSMKNKKDKLNSSLESEQNLFDHLLFSNSDDEDNLGKRTCNPMEIAEMNGGKMLKMKKTKEGNKVSFTCKMNHRFSLFTHQKHQWCKVCDTLFKNAKKHASDNGGALISKELDSDLVFECEQKHQWTVSYKKCLRSWCKVCKKQRKKMVKEILAEEKKRIESERKQKQDKMLEEARMKMMKDNSKMDEELSQQIKTFKILEDEISRIASKYAREFTQKRPDSDFEQIVELYKVLILPEKSIRLYFEALSNVELKKEFRRYTILLHPDKNCHPKSKSSFQKIFGIFDEVMKRRKTKTG